MSERATSANEPDITPPLFKYGLIAIGLIITLFSGFVMEWKSSSAQDAEGDWSEIDAEIKNLREEAKDADSASDKKDLEQKAKDLEEEDLKDARKEADSEKVDASDGIWLFSMVNYIGISLICLGLLALLGIGNNYEKVGALVALGFLVAQMM